MKNWVRNIWKKTFEALLKKLVILVFDSFRGHLDDMKKEFSEDKTGLMIIP